MSSVHQLSVDQFELLSETRIRDTTVSDKWLCVWVQHW
ncbi:Uncharacterised protein [Mycobacteroides abscessus subsp. abscessus]|nr:Uncharacterised protein [Mycobacteroides abscessus subsp. abscessus]